MTWNASPKGNSNEGPKKNSQITKKNVVSIHI